MTPTEEQIARHHAAAHRTAVASLMDDLRAVGLDLYWEGGEVPRLSDGKLTPWPTLAARHPYLAGRVDELFGPGGEKTVSAETEHQLKPILAEAGKGETRDVLAAREHQISTLRKGQQIPVGPNLGQRENGDARSTLPAHQYWRDRFGQICPKRSWPSPRRSRHQETPGGRCSRLS